MKIREKLFIPLFAIVIFLGVTGHFLIAWSLSAFFDRQISDYLKSRMADISHITETSSQNSLNMASLFVEMARVRSAMEVAGMGNIDDPEDPMTNTAREQLRRQLAPLLEGYENINGRRLKLHFHLPNGRSLVRLWREKQIFKDGEWQDISDDISDFRHMVMDANKEREALKGIELGRGGFVIRGIIPIESVDGKHLGSVEVLTDFDHIIELAVSDPRIQSYLYMDKKYLSVARRLQDSKKHPETGKNHILVHGSYSKINETHIPFLNQDNKDFVIENNGETALIAFPIRDYKGARVGVFVFQLDVSHQKRFIRILIWQVTGFLGIILLSMGFIVSKMLSKNVLTPVDSLICFSEKISRGDLSTPLKIKQRDEIGMLADALNNMAVSLAQMFGEIVEGIDTLNDSASDISGAVDAQAAVLSQQSGSVSEITSTLSELLASFSQITEHTDQVARLADNAFQNSKSGADAVAMITAKMEEICRDNQHNMHEVAALGQKSKEIAKVMGVINNISDQTKLIAFNAALEAASAGEAGKRFGVVAAEIRRLATSVTESTGEIERRIREIQEAANKMVIASERGVKRVQEGLEYSASTSNQLADIVNGAQSTADAAKQIALSTQQQKTASEQVVIALKEIDDGSSHTAGSIRKLSNISRDLAELSSYLKSQVDNFRLGYEDDEE